MTQLRFEGSVWLNLEIALRHLKTVYDQAIAPMGLDIVEWYILQTLYEEDGQMPSRLAAAIGRPATSFTPILDKLQAKGFIERQINSADRRAVGIYVTKEGRAIQEQIKMSVVKIENALRERFPPQEWERFQTVIAIFQQLKLKR